MGDLIPPEDMFAAVEAVGYRHNPHDRTGGVLFSKPNDPTDVLVIDAEEPTDLDDLKRTCELEGQDYDAIFAAVEDQTRNDQ